ncbi:hypothetical protein ACFQ1I_39005 [Kitasatospora arboriphila]
MDDRQLPQVGHRAARRADLNAVFIPHEHTWVLEHEEFGAHTATLELASFTELLTHF